ncbi:phosphohydrolase [Pelagerythrobacter aerophilus]|uniref:Phosphohydrolase n=2 Tax=Pelagerythrobacter aerophilus TaxID=2306995 RepID=A0A418NKJ0_9SPHN|nr:phosphohydrolase [Pelagerythrobacter aerophilus]
MRLTARLDGLPAGTPPMRLLLLSDIHVSGPDMPPERLARIVEQANRLQPDVVLIAGDFVSEKRTATRLYSAAEAIAPLAALKAPLGKIAVPGNHDHWFGVAAVRRELERAGFTVLANAAVRAGPLAIGGIDDDYTGHADPSAALAAVDRLGGGRVLLSHSPDPFPDLPAGFGLMLAGHTHCGQIRYPWGGSPATMSAYGDRYACGTVRENGNLLVTTAGLGTSVLPFRLFSRPEMWLIEVVPAGR